MTELSAPPPPPVYPPYPPPALAAPVVKAPRKWLGRKGGLLIVAFGTVVWFGYVLFYVLIRNESEAPTNSLFIGAFTVASAFVYTMAYRLRPSDGLSVSRLVLAFVVGGLLSATLAAPFDYLDNLWTGGTGRIVSLGSLSLAGIVEELAKIVLVLVFSIGLGRRNVRNGLFLGGAVGFGFAAFEDVGYARAAWNDAVAAHAPAFPAEVWSVVSRDVLGIFGHPLFTALLAAAVFAAVRNGRFRITWRVVLAYLGVALAHGLFDVSGTFVYRATFNYIGAQATFYGVALVEAIVLSLIWRRVSRRANRHAMLSQRHATSQDLPFLELMLVEATNWDGLRGTTPTSVQDDPTSSRYLDGWQRATDFGVVALEGDRPVGAAWARFLPQKDAGYGYVEDSIPELTLAVARGARGFGVGARVLTDLIESARDLGLPGLSLSVEDGNVAARKLYEKAGFTVVGRNGNSDTMLLRLHP